MSGGNQRLPFYMASNATINGGNYQVQCTTMNVYNATGNNVITTTGGGLDGTLHNLTNTQLITSDTPSFQVTVGTTYINWWWWRFKLRIFSVRWRKWSHNYM